MKVKCPRKPHAAYRAAIKADDAFSRELTRVYGAKNAGDARYYYPSNSRYKKDAKLEAAAKRKLKADVCLRKTFDAARVKR